MGQALLHFGNIELTNGWNLTVQDGVRPCACMVQSPPHLAFLQVFADLVIEQDGRQRIFRDCHIADPVFHAGMDGQEWTLPILDRRWKWQGATISGSYNVRQADETLLREKTPQDLATLLLNKMGETNIDVTALSLDPRPHVTWDNANAAQELDRLCADLGCTVNIDQDGSNFTYLDRIGDGPLLPPGPALGGEYSLQAKPLPSAIKVVCDRTIFENLFTLEAIGLDTDYQYKLPDDLSFKPPTGWEKEFPDGLYGVTGTYVDPLDGETKLKRELAAHYVYRSYRISGIVVASNWQPWGTGAQPSPNWIDDDLIPQRYRDLEVLQSRASEVLVGDNFTGQKEALPAIVQGDWYEWMKGKITGGIWPWGFSIDSTRGLVHLSQPAFLYDPTTPDMPFSFAQLTLKTAFYAGRDGVFQEQTHFEPVPDSLPGASEMPFYRRELRRRIITGFSAQDNFSDLDNELTSYALDLVDQLSPTDSTAVEYQEIRDDIDLTGKCRQITYEGGGGKPGTTKVSLGTPHNPYIATSDEQRLPRELRDALRGVQRLGAVDYNLPIPMRLMGQS